MNIDFAKYAAADARKKAAVAEIEKLRAEMAPHLKAATDADYVLEDRKRLLTVLAAGMVRVERGDTVAMDAGAGTVGGRNLSLYMIAGGLADEICSRSSSGKSRVKAEDGGWTVTRNGRKLRRVSREELEEALRRLEEVTNG